MGDAAGEQSPDGAARRVAKTVLWPARRFFDPRFVGLHEAVLDVRRLVEADLNAANEVATFTGRTLDTIVARLDEQGRQLAEQGAQLEDVRSEVDKLARLVGFDPDVPHSLDELSEHFSALLNFESGHEGFSAQSGLWFNPPVSVLYEPGRVQLRWVNERVVEAPYVFRALGAVDPDAKVLDVGATESTVSLSLATIGYHVTAVDPRPNPLSHERLEVVVAAIEEWETDNEFDAVVCLSTIEHIGTGAYEQEQTDRRVDLEAMKRIHELTRAGGLLVLTTAVGQPSVDDFGRVYDRAGLDELLEGWDVTDLTLVQRRDPLTWVTVDESIDELAPNAETVALISATKTAA